MTPVRWPHSSSGTARESTSPKSPSSADPNAFRIRSCRSFRTCFSCGKLLPRPRRNFPLAIQASRILGVDEALRPQWQDIADHLASPAPGSGNRGTFDQTKGVYARQIADEVSAASGLPVPRYLAPAPANVPVGTTRANSVFGGFVGRGPGAIEPLGAEPELKRRFLGFNMTGGFIDPAGDGGAQIFRNRLRLREGPGAIDAEHLGGLAFGIHQSLLSSSTDDTVSTSTMEVFPNWPKEWAV